MSAAPTLRDRRGIALMIVLLVALFVSSVAIAAAMLSMNSGLIRRASTQASVLNDAALASVEEGRSAINGNKALYPDSGYNTLISNGQVLDASGTAIPGLTRSVYVGPTGITSGQYGVFGSVLSVVQDARGNKTVLREEVNQESFAKYAYFTDIEPSGIKFGGGDQIFGPVHTNDDIKIYSSGAKFWDDVNTAGIVADKAYGTFVKGYHEHVTPIPMPSTADVTKLKTQATAGNMAFTSTNNGDDGEATTRIEFVAVDLDGDGTVTGPDEGFIRVYQSNDPTWVVAGRQSTIHDTYNCGDYNVGKHATYASGFSPARSHPSTGTHNRDDAMRAATSKCFLGGDPELTGGFVANTPAPYPSGKWLPWPGAVDPRVTAARPADAAYLWPITRALNPNFKGVIFVTGKVAISGVVRGRVTLASSSSIIIPDDVRQATDPGAGVCEDILGLFAQQDVVVSDNMINAPVKVGGSGTGYRTMDPDGDPNEFIHAVVLALDNFTVENYDSGPTNIEDCESTNWGRGCLYLTGGIIQNERGAVGTTSGTGNVKRYSYNTCALSDPPPYFPTTGHFAKNRIYELDPTNFNAATWFAANQPAP